MADIEGMATSNEILRFQVGSGAVGLALEGTDDRDELGICIPPPEFVIGLRKFEQYQYRTQPEGVRSGPGDLDLTIYSLQKFVRLASKGNPSILTCLFSPPESILKVVPPQGEELLQLTEHLLSREAGLRFAGYMHSQLAQFNGTKNKHTNRPELIEKYGLDTKAAYHTIRLGLQGIELLETGNITLPMAEPYRSEILSIRQGGYTKEQVIAWAEVLEQRLYALADGESILPEKADMQKVDRALIEMHNSHWGMYRLNG